MSDGSNQEILRHLDAVDWPNLTQRMIAYAIQLARTEYHWRGGTELVKGRDIQDIVFTVIKKLYSGERTWDPERVPLAVWLSGNIRSEMNRLFRSVFSSAGIVREVPLEPDEETGLMPGTSGNGGGIAREPEAALLIKEQQEKRDKLIAAVYAAIEGDKLLELIFYAILDGFGRKPATLAEHLDVPVSEINNALKRLDRHVARVAQEMETGNE